jgi:dephospho-CoA kinase
MRILGLTGSIGMGKSTTAALFRRLRVPVHDSDAVSRAVTAPGGLAVPSIAKAFPGIGADGVIDRRKLASVVFSDAAALRRLEAILHPLVAASRKRFLARHARAKLVVLDIPLLFEIGAEAICDAVLVVTAPAWVQRQRALRRPGMTREKLAQILARQVPDREKRRRADFVVQTGAGRRAVLRRLRVIAKHLSGKTWTRRRHARDRARYGNHRA